LDRVHEQKLTPRKLKLTAHLRHGSSSERLLKLLGALLHYRGSRRGPPPHAEEDVLSSIPLRQVLFSDLLLADE